MSDHPVDGALTKRCKLSGELEDGLCLSPLHKDISFPSPAVYAGAKPYPHGRVEPVLNENFYVALKTEVLQLRHTRKETDLYKLTQSPDFKNLELNPQIHADIPSLLKVCNLLYSKEFRSRIEIAAGLSPGTLIEKTDLASSVYTKASYLAK